MTEESKLIAIAKHQTEIMKLVGLDVTDPAIIETPKRIAKLLVNDLFWGIDEDKKPHMKTFPNDHDYDQMLIQKDIVVQSVCEHHFVPFIGVAHVAYIPKESIVGLSKIIRLVDYYARRPQVQERLTQQIAKAMQEALGTENVAVVIEAKHLCYTIRGIKDHSSNTSTSYLGGVFTRQEVRAEFFNHINKPSNGNL